MVLCVDSRTVHERDKEKEREMEREDEHRTVTWGEGRDLSEAQHPIPIRMLLTVYVRRPPQDRPLH